MSLGVPALDADHRSIFRVVDALHGIRHETDCHRTIAGILETLELYGQNHFMREQQVMAAIGFPGAEFHESEHRGFARYIRTLQNAARKGSDPQLAMKLFEYLSGWLRHHILIQDMAFKPYIVEPHRAERVALHAAPIVPKGVSSHLAF